MRLSSLSARLKNCAVKREMLRVLVAREIADDALNRGRHFRQRQRLRLRLRLPPENRKSFLYFLCLQGNLSRQDGPPLTEISRFH